MCIEVQDIRIESPYMITKPGLSEEEYFALTNEDTHSELIEGEMIMFSPATPGHERIFGFLLTLLGLYVQNKNLGEALGSRCPMRLKEGTLPEPDILFVSNDRRSLFKEKYLDGPADLVVEIISEGTRRYVLQTKRPLYHTYQVRECWFIDPESQEITVDYLEGEDYRSEKFSTGRVKSNVVMGFWLEAHWLWQDPLPNTLELLRQILE